MKQKYYILYKATNLKNNKFYIGVHETFNLNDGYLGSGKRFKNSLYYHGKENFKREILDYFDNSKSMYNREREIVNEELLKNPKCLNLKIGGTGGFTEAQWKLGAKKMNEIIWNDINFIERKKIEQSKRFKKLHKENKLTSGKDSYDWTGKHHSEETKKKIAIKSSANQKGIKNSQYGTCWITNEKENKKIYRGDEIPKGFRLGRKISTKSYHNKEK